MSSKSYMQVRKDDQVQPEKFQELQVTLANGATFNIAVDDRRDGEGELVMHIESTPAKPAKAGQFVVKPGAANMIFVSAK